MSFHSMSFTSSYEMRYTVETVSLKTRHIFKSCNIYLKPERFRKSKFTLSKVTHSDFNLF